MVARGTLWPWSKRDRGLGGDCGLRNSAGSPSRLDFLDQGRTRRRIRNLYAAAAAVHFFAAPPVQFSTGVDKERFGSKCPPPFVIFEPEFLMPRGVCPKPALP